MATYVLILAIYTLGRPAVTAAEFQSEAACKHAGEIASKGLSPFNNYDARFVCVPKGQPQP